MAWILESIIIIIVTYFICAPKIEIIREFKRKRKQSRQEENLSETGMTKGAKTFQFMIVSSIIITIIFTIVYSYIRKVEFTISLFLWEVLFVFICESIIGSFLAFIEQAILRYKKEGFIKATVTLVISIIIIIGIMYVKYKNLISK